MNEVRALVYDDDEAFADECAEALSRWGYAVRTRAGRSNFAALLESVCPDLLILDLHMPDFDGIEALRAVRDREAHAGLTIVIVSAADGSLIASAETIAKAYGLNLGGVLKKPFKLAALEELLTRLSAADKTPQT